MNRNTDREEGTEGGREAERKGKREEEGERNMYPFIVL